MSDVVPKDLQDPQIMLLRASVTSARKDLDDIMVEVDDQVAHIKAAKGRATPKAAMMQYRKALLDLLENGDKLLVSFNTKNGSLLEKLELLLLRFETSDPEQHTKVKSIRDKLVGEAHPYRGRFRKLRIEHEKILSGL